MAAGRFHTRTRESAQHLTVPSAISSVGFKVTVLSRAQRQQRPPRITGSPLWEAGLQLGRVAPPPTHSSHSHRRSRNNTAMPIFLPAAGLRQRLERREIKEKARLPVPPVLNTDGRGLPTQLPRVSSSLTKQARGRENTLSLCKTVRKWLLGRTRRLTALVCPDANGSRVWREDLGGAGPLSSL